jgi:methylmalonyl-CoA mutase
VFGTIAARFNDDGVTAVYQHLRSVLDLPPGTLARADTDVSTGSTVVVPPARERYLADVADTVRRYHAETEARVRAPGAASTC